MDRQSDTESSQDLVLLLCASLHDDLSAGWMNALKHPCRRRLLRALNSQDPSFHATPEALAGVVRASRGVVTYHLRVLVGHELVGCRPSTESTHAAYPPSLFHSRVREDAGVGFVLGATQSIDQLAEDKGTAPGGHVGFP